jgi:type I restriction enzyme S subunit
MSERSEAMEQRGVRDAAAAAYQVVPADAEQADVPPGYKWTEVGVVPRDWQLMSVGEMGEVVAGKALAAKGPGQPRPYLRTKNVFDGRIDLDDVLTMPMTDSEFAKYALRHGDVLLNEGQTLELVGRCAIYKSEYPASCAIQNQLIRFRARTGVSGLFASHLFRYCQKNGAFSRIALQTTSVAHLGASRLQKLVLAWPSTESEQRAIATALSDADALIESLDRLIAKKRAIKQAAMQQLLTGQTRLPGFAGEWETRRLGGSCQITTGEKDVNEGNPKGQFPFFTCSRNHTYSDTYSFDCDAILIAGNGEVGNLNRYSGKFEAYQRNYVLKDFEVNIEFLWQYLCTYLAIELGLGKIGSTIPYIKREHLLNFRFSLPKDKEEQTAIATVLSDMDTEIEALERRRDKARQIKQGMMQQLLTGRVRLMAPGAAAGDDGVAIEAERAE